MSVIGLSAVVGAVAGVAAHLVAEGFERWLAARQTKPEETPAEEPPVESEENSHGS